MKRSIGAIVATLVIGGSAQAGTITFEKLADGVTTPTSLSSSATNEYAGSGVTFDGGGGAANQPLFRAFSSLSSAIATLPPVSNQFFIFDQTKVGTNFDLDIFFSASVFSASGDVVINPNFSMTVTATSSSNDVLGSIVIPAGASTWIAGSFSFSTATAIARINLLPSASNVSAGLDNLTFNTNAVPEPMTFGQALAGLMLVAFARWCLHRRFAAF